MEILNNLHFLRPQWFYAFIPLAVLLIILVKNQTYSESWRRVCDARLLPFILTAKQGKRSILSALLTFLGASLCITALAQPVYKKLPQPVFREQSALVILLDLSQSMNATDIKPSRIERAKLELLDVLKQRKGGQTALIVYAANAFTVTPLTDDNNTIANLLPVLQPSMMPAQGSNLGRALYKAHSLFTQAGITRGDILVVTDGIHSRFLGAVKKIRRQGYRVSVFGIGTAQGSPIPLDNGFLQDASGAIVIPKLKINALRNMAREGGGIYVSVTADESDTLALTKLFASQTNSAIRNGQIIMTDLHADRWREDGVWLLLPLLLIAALWTRKGWLAVFVIFLLPLPQPGYAAEANTNPVQKLPAHTTPGAFSLHNLSLDNLWLTPNQKAIRAFRQGKNNEAAKKFTNPEWKASALYRSGKYAQAAKLFEQAGSRDKKQATDSSNDFYNKGNALAKIGQYQQSIDAYNKALTLNKHNKDAAYNRKLVKKALQKKKQQQKQQQKKSSGQSGNKKSAHSKSSQQKNKNRQGSKQNSSKKNTTGKGNKQNTAQKNAGGKGQKQQSQPSGKNGSKNQAAQNSSRQGNRNRNSSQQQDEAMKKRHPGDAQSKKEKQEQQAIKQAEKNQKNSPQNKQNQSARTQSNNNTKPAAPKSGVSARDNTMTEDQKATEQWLRRIPDDPGGLLRRKFLYQYQQLPNQHDSKQPW